MEATTVKIDPKEEIGFMAVDETDFARFLPEPADPPSRNGGLCAPAGCARRRAHSRAESRAMQELPMGHKDYSEAQTFHHEPQCASRMVAELIGYPPVAEFLKALMGPKDIVFTHGLFTRTLSGSPGISMHTDGQPFGSSIFGFEGSSPRLLRVLYYLDDLPPERAPFRLIPRSPSLVSRPSQPVRALCLAPARDHALCQGWFGRHDTRPPLPRHPSKQGFGPSGADPVRLPASLGGTGSADGGLGLGMGGTKKRAGQ